MGYILKRVVLALIFSLAGIGFSVFMMSKNLSQHGGVEGLIRSVRVYQLRKSNPLWSQTQIDQVITDELANPNSETAKLMQKITLSGAPGFSQILHPLKTMLGQSSNLGAKPTTPTGSAQSIGSQNLIRGSTEPSLQPQAQQNGHTGLLSQSHYRDPNVRARIQRMAIPDELRQQLLNHYDATGVFPNPAEIQSQMQREQERMNRKPAQSLDDIMNEI